MKQFRDTQFYVTEHGDVFRRDARFRDNRIVPAKVRPMSQQPYLRVTDYTGGRDKDYFVHHMVMECYGVPCPGTHGRAKGQFNIHHMDEDKTNNDITNLEWMLHEHHCAEHNPAQPGSNYQRKSIEERRQENIDRYDRRLAKEGKVRQRHLTPRESFNYKTPEGR